MEDNKPKRKSAAKQLNPIEAKSVETVYTKELNEEFKVFERLVHPSKEQCDRIFALYNQFCTPYVARYSTSCSCHNDISNLYSRVMNWYQANKELFEQ